MRKLKIFEHISLDGVIQIGDSTLSQPRWQRCSPRGVWRELRSAAWPAHLRSVVWLLAEGAEQSYV